MEALLTIVHVIVCVALIGIVLLQQGKGASMGAVFGGSSQTLFGASGATTLLGKLTAAAAVVFMITSLGLTMVGKTNKGGNAPEEVQAPASAPAPVEAPKQ